MKEEICPTCNGYGQVQVYKEDRYGRLIIVYETCTDCGGSGYKYYQEDED